MHYWNSLSMTHRLCISAPTYSKLDDHIWRHTCHNSLLCEYTVHAELNSEQKALLDFMVLSRGRGFVGFGSSTFSFYLREYRVLSGVPRSSSVLVDASVIGTDPLFNSAGTVI